VRLINERGFSGWFGLWFLFVAVLAVAQLGVMGWAVIKLVTWLTQ
jgi:hypothetical protein